MEAAITTLPGWDNAIFGFNQGTLIAIMALLAAAQICRIVVIGFIQKVFDRFTIENPIALDAVRDSRGSLGTAAGAALVYWGLAEIALASSSEMPSEVARWLPAIALLIVHVAIVLWAFHLVPIVHAIVAKLDDDDELDGSEKTLISALESVLRFLIVAFGAVYIADGLGFDLTALVAGLGISGLALALAAKDSISNFFGAITVLLDRPFRVGDWIVVGGAEGEVEAINLRTTQIRTSIDTVITLPNASLVSESIENYGRRRWRRYQPTFHLDLDSEPGQVDAFCSGVLKLIEENERTTNEGSSFANVAMLGPQSVDVQCNLYWDISSGKQEREARDALLRDVMRLAKDLGLRFFEPRVRRQLNE